MSKAWSYSAIKTFDQCPKKYFHLKVAKDYEDRPGEEAIYGTEVHAAAEEYIKNGTEVPEKYKIIKPVVERLNTLPGEKYAELKVGVRQNNDGFHPCGFLERDVWYRGIIDLLVVDGNRAWLVDYKTGKNAKYADPKQLDLMAAATFVHFPEIKTIKSALLYVVSGEMLEREHVAEDLDIYFNVFEKELTKLDAAFEHNVWNAKDGPLCGWCPVKSCSYWRPRR